MNDRSHERVTPRNRYVTRYVGVTARLLCLLGLHVYSFVSRRSIGGRWYIRTDQCARCQRFDDWYELDGVKRWKTNA